MGYLCYTAINKRMSKELRYFTEADIHKANKRKKGLTISVIRKINIKTTKDITTHPLVWIKCKRLNHIKCWGRFRGTGILILC